MRRVHGNTMQNSRSAWRLPCMLFALAAAGAAVAEQAQPPANEEGKAGKAHTSYRVVNLGSGPLSAIPRINAKGQVAFSINPGPGLRGYFYNGAGVPARLQFDLPGLNFRSDDLRPLGQQGAERVFEGSGRIGSAGNYRFRLAISAGAAANPAQFALRIWHVDPLTKAEVLDYDNAVMHSGQAANRIVEGGIVHE